MANVAIKSEKLSPFGGTFSIMEQYDSKLSSVINSTLGMTCRLYGYQYSENLQGRTHVLAGKVASTSVENAVHCKDGCSTLRRRLQCTASEMGKTGNGIVNKYD